jgi:hypothetical protein
VRTAANGRAPAGWDRFELPHTPIARATATDTMQTTSPELPVIGQAWLRTPTRPMPGRLRSRPILWTHLNGPSAATARNGPCSQPDARCGQPLDDTGPRPAPTFLGRPRPDDQQGCGTPAKEDRRERFSDASMDLAHGNRTAKTLDAGQSSASASAERLARHARRGWDGLLARFSGHHPLLSTEIRRADAPGASVPPLISPPIASGHVPGPVRARCP